MGFGLRKELVTDAQEEEVLREVLDALHTIRYGSIQIILQDGKVVQLEKVEKMRFPRRSPCP